MSNKINTETVYRGNVIEQWCKISDYQYSVSGVLTRDTVPSLWRYLSNNWTPKVDTVEVSLEQLQRTDSSGMVMLIHLIQHAKNYNCHIMLSAVPAELNMLFKLSNIDGLMVTHIKN